MIIELKVLHPLYGGMSLAREKGIFFVKGAIPDEIVETRIIEKKRDYSITEVLNVTEPSPFRQIPPCPVFGECGGCHYQHIAYEKQLSMKQEIIVDCLQRIGKFEEINLTETLSSSPFRYRHRAHFKINNGRIGFYQENTHDIVEFNTCLLLRDELNIAYSKLKQLDIPPDIGEIILTFGNNIIAYLPAKEIDSTFVHTLVREEIVNGTVTDNDEMVGNGYSEFYLDNIRYTVSARSFLQSNWDMNRKLSDILFKHFCSKDAQNKSNHGSKKKLGNLIDIFGGAGNFSLPIAEFFDSITVIDENKYSIEDGRRNARMNNINNIKFLHSKVEDIHMRGKYHTVVIDPPRIGLTKKTLNKLFRLAPETLFYISCNPATLSRDAGKLKEKYHLNSVTLVDMFPQTYHCEILCHFSLK